MGEVKDYRAFMDRGKFVPPEPHVYEIDGKDSGAPRSVLLLEDDDEFAEMVREFLETCEFEVTVVRDGVQGLKKVMERDFDVIVCDLLMPNLPGDMFYVGVERVRPHLANRFIFITGHQNHPKFAEFVRKTRALTLYKPFQLHVLLETIQVSLKKSTSPNVS